MRFDFYGVACPVSAAYAPFHVRVGQGPGCLFCAAIFGFAKGASNDAPVLKLVGNCSIAKLYQQRVRIGGAVGENLRQALDWLPKGRALLTAKRDVSLPLALPDLADGGGDTAKLRELYERFGFRSWRRELDERGDRREVCPPPTRPTGAVCERNRRHGMPRCYCKSGGVTFASHPR